MRHYEFLFILKPTLNEEELKNRVASVNETITKNGGEIAKCDEIGIKTLAYEIQKNARGYYVVVYFKAPPSAIKEIERVARINEDLIKFLTVKFESKKDLAQWEKLSRVKEEKSEVAQEKIEPKEEDITSNEEVVETPNEGEKATQE